MATRDEKVGAVLKEARLESGITTDELRIRLTRREITIIRTEAGESPTELGKANDYIRHFGLSKERQAYYRDRVKEILKEDK